MSYISGSFDDYEDRVHQFTRSVNDLSLYYLEAINSNYTGLSYISKNTKNHWNREFIRQGQIINFPTGVSGTLFP